MRIRLSSRAATPLIEMTIVLFFFAFVCTVVLQMFAASDRKSRLAQDINQATAVAQNYAEQLKGQSLAVMRNPAVLPGFTAAAEQNRQVLTLGLDENWNPVTEIKQARFLTEIRLEAAADGGGMAVTGTLAVYRMETADGPGDQRELLISLPIGEYDPQG